MGGNISPLGAVTQNEPMSPMFTGGTPWNPAGAESSTPTPWLPAGAESSTPFHHRMRALMGHYLGRGPGGPGADFYGYPDQTINAQNQFPPPSWINGGEQGYRMD